MSAKRITGLLFRQCNFGADRRTWITPIAMQWYRENGIGWWPVDLES